MSDQDFQDLKRSVERIESGLFGDPKIGHVGIVGTQQDHDRRLKQIEKFGLYCVGAGFIITLAWAIFVQWPRIEARTKANTDAIQDIISR